MDEQYMEWLKEQMQRYNPATGLYGKPGVAQGGYDDGSGSSQRGTNNFGHGNAFAPSYGSAYAGLEQAQMGRRF